MQQLNLFDYASIALYFVALIALGLYLRRRASRSLEHYLLGGRAVPWWALGITGMASFLDMSGTMLISSLMYLLGPRALYIEFRGGACLILAVMMVWSGKWHRRSGCMTMGEWLILRFGNSRSGRGCELVWVLVGLIGTIGMLAYLIIGAGIFLSCFVPLSPLQCAVLLVLVGSFYTVLSGFYGLVVTDILQSLIILAAVIVISLMAYDYIGANQTDLSALAGSVTGNREWAESTLQWYTHMPPSHAAFSHLFLFCMFYLMRSVLGGMGSGGDPKYFAARSERECGLLSAVWIASMSIRWPLMLAFGFFGLLFVQEKLRPDTQLQPLLQSITRHYPQLCERNWSEQISRICNNSSQQPEQLQKQLQQTLGHDWPQQLMLIGHDGNINPETILPVVINHYVPQGLKGLFLVALIAAALSTFASNVNTATGLFSRNIYQRYINPQASDRKLIYVSWLAAVVMIALSFFVTLGFSTINAIWGWLIMGLGGGTLAPQVLRLYWQRFSAQGCICGILAGMCSAILQLLFWPQCHELLAFMISFASGAAGSVIGTLLGKPDDEAVVSRFYRLTLPFGWWKREFAKLPVEARQRLRREHRNELLSLPFALLWQISLFLLPMQALLHAWQDFLVTLGLNLVASLGLYVFWYRPLQKTSLAEELLQNEKSTQADQV